MLALKVETMTGAQVLFFFALPVGIAGGGWIAVWLHERFSPPRRHRGE
jgi:hypothetical protein